MTKRAAKSGTRSGSRPIVGKDASGSAVRIGDLVDHTQLPLQSGIVITHRDPETGQLLRYGGEPAAIVAYPDGHTRSNRFSKMVVTGKATAKTLAAALAAEAARPSVRASNRGHGVSSAMRALASKLPKVRPGPPPSQSLVRKKVVQGGRPESNKRRH